MSAGASANSGSGAVRSEHRFDEKKLADWMATNVANYRGPLTVEQFNGGQSNPTFKLITPYRAYVMRRKPSGDLVRGAHAVEREARVMTALRTTGFPTPEIFGLCTDDGVIGSWFYVMELIEGRIFWDASLPEMDRSDRGRAFDAMNATIAQLHAIDVDAIGLEDFGKREAYLARQIRLWSNQYANDLDAGRNDDMDWLVEWLPNNLPGNQRTTLVHGDFKVDNLIFHPRDPVVIGVIDWELSTLGDPLADFAFHLMMYRMPPDIVAGLKGADLASLGIPSEQDYVAAYANRRGTAQIDNLDLYLAFNFFRLAAIFHGIAGRVLRGTAASPHAAARGKNFSRLARLAREQVDV